MSAEDLFADPAPSVPRDRWGRPLIVPPGGGDPVPYTRISTFASALDDARGLTIWKLRLVALGVGRHEDLAAMLAGLDYDCDKAQIDEVIETAIDRAGGTAKANWGTAVHKFTEPDAAPFVPARMRQDVDAYQAALDAAGITVVDTEAFVVNDAFQVAGTFDHLYDVPGLGIVVGDKKTGKLHLDACSVQLAMYAGGVRYEVDAAGTPTRTPLEIRREDVGIVIHLPAGSGVAEIVPVNIAAGREDGARLATEVMAFRKRKDLRLPDLAAPAETAPVVEMVYDLEDRIGDAGSVNELIELKDAHLGVWTAEHSALANARWVLLKAGVAA